MTGKHTFSPVVIRNKRYPYQNSYRTKRKIFHGCFCGCYREFLFWFGEAHFFCGVVRNWSHLLTVAHEPINARWRADRNFASVYVSGCSSFFPRVENLQLIFAEGVLNACCTNWLRWRAYRWPDLLRHYHLWMLMNTAEARKRNHLHSCDHLRFKLQKKFRFTCATAEMRFTLQPVPRTTEVFRHFFVFSTLVSPLRVLNTCSQWYFVNFLGVTYGRITLKGETWWGWHGRRCTMATASARTTSTVPTVGVEEGSLINGGKKNKLLVVATICASVVHCFRTPYCLMRYSRAIFNYELKTCHLRWLSGHRLNIQLRDLNLLYF